MGRERGDVVERRRVKRQQRLVDQSPNQAVERRVRLGAEEAERPWEVEQVLAKRAPLDRPWIADEAVVRPRLPAVSGETAASLIGRDRRIRARVGVREDRVGILVDRDRTTDCNRRCGGNRLSGLRRRAAPAGGGQDRDGRQLGGLEQVQAKAHHASFR